MTRRLGVVPSYGRDYKSKKAIEADLIADKDFTIADMASSYDGKQVNLTQLLEAGVQEVNVRYKQLTQVAVFNVATLVKRAQLPAVDASPDKDEGGA